MKRITMFLVALALLFSMSACSKVPAGHVGIKVNLLGSSKGVDIEELPVGRYWIGFNEELYIFPTFTQNYVWTADKREGSPDNESISFQTVEGMTVNTDIGISYHIEPSKVNSVFQKYRRGVNEITDIFLRNMVRDAFVSISSTHEVEYVYGAGKAEILAKVNKMVADQLKDQGIVIENIYLISELRLPDAVVESINNKIKATQKAQQRENEVREAEADAKKAFAKAEGEAKSILAVAKAQADANIILAKSITNDLVHYKSVEKWNGILPSTMLPNSSVPFVPVNK